MDLALGEPQIQYKDPLTLDLKRGYPEFLRLECTDHKCHKSENLSYDKDTELRIPNANL